MQRSSLAIQLGRSADRGTDPQKVFPFIYSFISSTDDKWDTDHSANNLSRMGILVGPGQVEKKIIRTDPDCIYVSQGVRYTAYTQYNRTLLNLTGTAAIATGTLDRLDGTGAAFLSELRVNDIIVIAGQRLVISSIVNDDLAYLFADAAVAVLPGNTVQRQAKTEFQWYEEQNLGLLPPDQGYWLEVLEPNLRLGTPLEQFIRVTFQVTSPNGRVLYGDVDQTPVNYGQDNRVLLRTIQGMDSGPGHIYTPNMFPSSAIITIEIQNLHPTKAITVGGAIFGMKVRL